MPDMSVQPPSSSPQRSPPSHIEVEEVTTIIRTPMLRPTAAFLRVIQFGGGKGETFTMNEIIDHVKKYIEDRKLYDEQDPRIVYCRGNDLGAAFNVDSFTISQVLTLFTKHCFVDRDSHLRINRQVFTRPLFDGQSDPSSQGSPISTQSPIPQPPSSSSSPSTLLSSSFPPVSSGPPSSSAPKHGFKSSPSAPSKSKWRPAPKFLSVIHLGGGKGELFTMNEIIDHVKKYIEDRKLYDEKDPRIVFCKGNDLGSAFGVDSFTIFEVIDLFKTHCQQVSEGPPLSAKGLEKHCDGTSSQTGEKGLSLPSFSSSISSTCTPCDQHPNLPKTASPPPPSCVDSKSSPVITARPASTTITHGEMDVIEVEDASIYLPSTSVSVTALDETDGDYASPWSCHVTVGTSTEPESLKDRTRHNSLVVEYSSDNFSVEYELVSSSEPEPANSRDSEESEKSPSNCEAAAFLLVCEESDIEYLADYSETESDSDVELCDEDKWQCSQCRVKNSAFYRNCSKCWSIRPDWLSNNHVVGMEGVKSADANSREKRGETVSSQSISFSEIDKESKECPLLVAEETAKHKDLEINQFPSFSQDSAIGSMACSQEPEDCDAVDLTDSLMIQPSKQESELLAEVEVDATKKKSKYKKRRYSTCLSDSQEEVGGHKGVSGSQQAKSVNDEADGTQAPTDPCVICLMRARTACIIHGKTGHQVCCYRCARRLKKQRKSCPICRRPIQRVVRNFF